MGVYAGTCNQLNIGAFMEKGLTMRGAVCSAQSSVSVGGLLGRSTATLRRAAGGQTPVQKFWNHLLELVMSGKLTPDMVITHNLPLSEAAKGYDMFHKKVSCIIPSQPFSPIWQLA